VIRLNWELKAISILVMMKFVYFLEGHLT